MTSSNLMLGISLALFGMGLHTILPVFAITHNPITEEEKKVFGPIVQFGFSEWAVAAMIAVTALAFKAAGS